MLARIETLYLGLLRVVILIIATLALVVAVFAFFSAVQLSFGQFGMGTGATRGPTLGQFIQERKLDTGAAAGGASTDTASVETLPIEIVDAARTLKEYTKGANGTTDQDWQRTLVAFQQSISPDGSSAYLASLKRLTDQLHVSTGTPLSPQNVMGLLQWHQQRFQAAWIAGASQRALNAGRLVLTIYVSGAAFFFFILIAFMFLFVKIERNLRVVHTVNVDESNA